MNEVEKMYRNSGIEKHKKTMLDIETGKDVLTLDSFYPKFTAEKQLAIIKLISKQGQLIIENWESDNRGFNLTFRANSNLRYITMDCITRKTVEEALAQIVNDLWQDLTDAERKQIKEILE